jgi:hypothetical protein
MKIQVPSISNTPLGGRCCIDAKPHLCPASMHHQAINAIKNEAIWPGNTFAQGLHFQSHDVSRLKFSLNETSAKSYDVMLFLFEVKHAMHRPVYCFMHTLQAANIIHSRLD